MSGYELRQLRNRLDWNQTKMSDYFDVDICTVIRWEKAEKVPHMVALLCKNENDMIAWGLKHREVKANAD